MANTHSAPSSSSSPSASSSLATSSSNAPLPPPPPPPPSSWVPFTLTQKEIHAFYTIDRSLYSRLVIELRRNPIGCIHVMALWIWFERVGQHKGNLVKQMLNYSNEMISALADEAVMCLMCVERDYYPPESDTYTLPLTQSLTGVPLCLRFFHENRAWIMPALMKIVNDVCLKALPDIMHEALRLQAPNSASADPASTNFHVPSPSHFSGFYVGNHHLFNSSQVNLFSPFTYFSNPITASASSFSFSNANMAPTSTGGASSFSFGNIPIVQPPTNPTGAGGTSSSSINVTEGGAQPIIREGENSDPPTSPSQQVQDEDYAAYVAKRDVMEMLDSMDIKLPGATGNYLVDDLPDNVPPAEKTILLTIWGGVISENELRDFFTSMFGDCLEAIYMQMQPSGEPGSHACLVVRSASNVDTMLNGTTCQYFYIRGKRVLAQKFEMETVVFSGGRRQQSSSSTSQRPAPSSNVAGTSYAYPSLQFGSLRSR